MRFESRMRPDDGWQIRRTPGRSATRRAVSWLEGDAGVELRIRKNNAHPSGITTGHLWQPSVSFTYGWAMARMRFTHPAGAHSAFWLQGAGYDASADPAARDAELDVVEYFGPTKGGRRFNHHAVWWRPAPDAALTSVAKRAGLVVDPAGWHEYGIEWSPAGYRFTIDGLDSLEVTEPAALSGRSKVPVLSLLVSDWEAPLLDREHLGQYRAQCDHVVIESA